MRALRGRIDGWDDLERGYDRSCFCVKIHKIHKKATELELKYKNLFREPNL